MVDLMDKPNRYKVNPKTALFIDDSQRNIDGALAVGLPGIHFKTPEQLKSDLLKLGVLR